MDVLGHVLLPLASQQLHRGLLFGGGRLRGGRPAGEHPDPARCAHAGAPGGPSRLPHRPHHPQLGLTARRLALRRHRGAVPRHTLLGTHVTWAHHVRGLLPLCPFHEQAKDAWYLYSSRGQMNIPVSGAHREGQCAAAYWCQDALFLFPQCLVCPAMAVMRFKA